MSSRTSKIRRAALNLARTNALLNAARIRRYDEQKKNEQGYRSERIRLAQEKEDNDKAKEEADRNLRINALALSEQTHNAELKNKIDNEQFKRANLAESQQRKKDDSDTKRDSDALKKEIDSFSTEAYMGLLRQYDPEKYKELAPAYYNDKIVYDQTGKATGFGVSTKSGRSKYSIEAENNALNEKAKHYTDAIKAKALNSGRSPVAVFLDEGGYLKGALAKIKDETGNENLTPAQKELAEKLGGVNEAKKIITYIDMNRNADTDAIVSNFESGNINIDSFANTMKRAKQAGDAVQTYSAVIGKAKKRLPLNEQERKQLEDFKKLDNVSQTAVVSNVQNNIEKSTSEETKSRRAKADDMAKIAARISAFGRSNIDKNEMDALDEWRSLASKEDRLFMQKKANGYINSIENRIKNRDLTTAEDNEYSNQRRSDAQYIASKKTGNTNVNNDTIVADSYIKNGNRFFISGYRPTGDFNTDKAAMSPEYRRLLENGTVDYVKNTDETANLQRQINALNQDSADRGGDDTLKKRDSLHDNVYNALEKITGTSQNRGIIPDFREVNAFNHEDGNDSPASRFDEQRRFSEIIGNAGIIDENNAKKKELEAKIMELSAKQEELKKLREDYDNGTHRISY